MGLIGYTALNAFWTVRRHTERLCAHLAAEDQCIQSMPDASPAKWHRAHTTWFFEQFILHPHLKGYQPFSPEFSYLFNSYYEAVGARHPRFARGMITRPTATDVTAYRAHVDAAMAELLASDVDLGGLLDLGLQHEQQHQELLLTDMLHGFGQNPLFPAVLPDWTPPAPSAAPDAFVAFPGGIVTVGHTGSGFAFDNEGPSHPVLLQPYRLANRPGPQPRLARFHGRWRLHHSHSVDVRGLGRRPGPWLARAPALARTGRRLGDFRPRWHRSRRSGRAGPPHQLV